MLADKLIKYTRLRKAKGNSCLPSLICHDISSIKGINRSKWIKNSPVAREHSHPAAEKHISLERKHKKLNLDS